MDTPAVITFVSDFGWRGGYVASCEAVMLSVAPDVRVMHVGHEVPLGDIREASRCLARVAPLGPPAVHLAVVDPGVGTGRRPLAVRTVRGDLLVGPDNGLLPPAAAALGGVREAWSLDALRVRGAAGLPVETLSYTFHGRDLFAPAAALLASGHEPGSLGRPIETQTLHTLPDPIMTIEGRTRRAEVVEVDRFGNVALCLDIEDIPGLPTHVSVRVDGEPDAQWVARQVHTFGDLAAGELGLMRDSWGEASLALNGASAAELLGTRVGGMIELVPAEPQDPSTDEGPHPTTADTTSRP